MSDSLLQPVGSHGCCLQTLFEKQVLQTPDRIAISFQETAITYAELNRRANQLARHLSELGVGPEVMVGLHVERSTLTLIGILGILKAGAAYVPLDPAYPPGRLSYMLQDTRLSVVVTQSELEEGLNPRPTRLVLLDSQSPVLARQSQENLDSEASPLNLAYVVYTSGSTGMPKGVMVSHFNVVRLFESARTHLSFDKEDTWTLFHSYSFGFSVWEMWGALLHGGRLVIVPQGISQSPEAFYELVSKERVTVLSQTPSAFRLFAQAEGSSSIIRDLHLRFIVFSGESVEPSLLEHWMARRGDERPQLINMYALSETAGELTYQRFTLPNLNEPRRSFIGIPLPDVQIHILDGQMQQVPTGISGEVYAGGPALARGYLNLPELTSARFVPNPFGQSGTRLYLTGDRARYLADGNIEFLGRADRQVKIRGYRVEPAEVQAVLVQDPEIAEALVVAREDGAGINQLVAYLVPRHFNATEVNLVVNQLRSRVRNELPDYMNPGSFVVIESLPLSPNGKLDLEALPVAPSDRPELHNEFVPPRTSFEADLCAIWSEVLGISKIGITDDFFDLGGDSLRGTQMILRVITRLGVRVSLRQVFEIRTVAGLAAAFTETVIDSQRAALAEASGVLKGGSQHPLASQFVSVRPQSEAARVSGMSPMDSHFMRLSIGKAKEAIQRGQFPIAACIVKNGEVITCVHNAVWELMDSTAHAEVLAIRAACKHLNTTDLSGCVIYTTCEPCPMCFSACDWANLSKIVFGACMEDTVRAGLGGINVTCATMKNVGESRIEVIGDVLREENLELYDLWLTARIQEQIKHGG